MATKTIGVTDDVYERLAAEKREDESFTDTIARLLDATTSDWRHGFGRYADVGGREFEQTVDEVRRSHAEGFASRQDELLEGMGVVLDERGNVVTAPQDDDDQP